MITVAMFFVGFSEEKFELMNLTSGVQYQVSIAAGNDVGFGEELKGFAVTSQENVLSDLPRADDSYHFYETNNNNPNKVNHSKPQNGLVTSDTSEERVTSSGVEVIDVIGVSVGGVVCVLLVVFTVVFVRRRHHAKRQQRQVLNLHPMVDYKSPQTVHVTSVQDADDIQLNIINHESYADVRGTLMRSPLDARRQQTTTASVTALASGTLGRKNKHMAEVRTGLQQAREWESTLQRQKQHLSDDSLTSPDDVMSATSPTGAPATPGEIIRYDVLTIRTNPLLKSTCSALSDSDWPTPPSDANTRNAQEGRAQTLLKHVPLSHSRYGSSIDTPSYHAILDGYISGADAVDDDDVMPATSTNQRRASSRVTSPQSDVSARHFGRVPSDYEQSSYQCFDPVS